MKKNSYDNGIFIPVILLMTFSIVMVASATVGLAGVENSAVVNNLMSQIVYFVIGLLALFFSYRFFSFKLFNGLATVLALIVTILLMLALVFPAVNGARAWIDLGFFSFQPSELAKLYIIVYCANYFPKFVNSKKTSVEIAKGPIILFGIWFLIILFLQGDFGSALVCLLILMICGLIVPGNALRGIRFISKIGFILIFLLLIFLMSPIGLFILGAVGIPEYMLYRFMSVVDPFSNIYGYSLQLYNSLLAFGKAEFFGQGFGSSTQKFGYLPEARTDFIFPIIIEELGVLGLILVFAPYIYMIHRIFKFSLLTTNNHYKILLVGTIGYLFVHFVLNVGGVSGILPLTGVPLIFISKGGSSTVIAMMLIGFCLNVVSRIKDNAYESY